MPELPEVQTVVNTLQPRLLGRTILSVKLSRIDVLQPPHTDLHKTLMGRQIRAIDRRGKKIVFTLDDRSRFYIHLGMSGRLTIESPDQPLLPHTHLRLGFEGSELRFRDPRRFGGIWWLGQTGEADTGLGPEPLQLRSPQLGRMLSRTSRPIKSALLDQSVIAGLGNIYVDEALFAAGIHPLTPARLLTVLQIAALNRAIKKVLRRAIRHRGSTLRDYRDAAGKSGSFQDLHCVYGRTGERCRRCRTEISRIVLGGRSTHFCPSCQPGKMQ